VRHLM